MKRPISNPWKFWGFKPGQNIICVVKEAEPGGYSVTIAKGNDDLPGFLPTTAQFKVGEEILAQYVCMHDQRILLKTRFSAEIGRRAIMPPLKRWEDDLYQLEDSLGLKPSSVQEKKIEQLTAQGQEAELPPPSPVSEAEAAFRVWAEQATAPKYDLRRATDLILPPLSKQSERVFKIAEHDLEWLLTDLEGGMRTGCMHVSNDEDRSRAAVLLCRGLAIGCIYSSMQERDPPPTDIALQKVLKELTQPATQVRIYELPEPLILSSSALFFGFPVTREDDYDARSYMDYICGFFQTKGNTACMAFTLSGNRHCFAYVHRGEYLGAFYVEEQLFTAERGFVYKLLEQDKDAELNVNILPPEITSGAMRFGYSLSMAQKSIN